MRASTRVKPLRRRSELSSSARPIADDEREQRHRDRPDQADAERVPEEPVARQLDEVAEADEVDLVVAREGGVGEPERHAADQRDHGEDEDGQQRRAAPGRWPRGARPAPAAPGDAPSGFAAAAPGAFASTAASGRRGACGCSCGSLSAGDGGGGAGGAQDGRPAHPEGRCDGDLCAGASGSAIRARRSSAATRPRSAAPRSTLVSPGRETWASSVSSMPVIAMSSGTAQPEVVGGVQRPDADQVVRRDHGVDLDRRGARAARSRRGSPRRW